jgi:hypothetical protein
MPFYSEDVTLDLPREKGSLGSNVIEMHNVIER